MATSSGKKGKKTSKKNKLSLGEFLTDGNAIAVSQVQVAVPIFAESRCKTNGSAAKVIIFPSEGSAGEKKQAVCGVDCGEKRKKTVRWKRRVALSDKTGNFP